MSKVGRRRKAEAGFTLVEMIIVVGIIAVLSAILSVAIRPVRASFALNRAATIVASEVRRAQARAIAEGESYTVEFVIPSSGTINVWRTVVTTVPSTTTLELQVTGENWPSSVTIAASSLPACVPPAGDAANQCVTFAFLGAPPPGGGGNIELRSDTGSTRQIIIEPTTGRVSIP